MSSSTSSSIYIETPLDTITNLFDEENNRICRKYVQPSYQETFVVVEEIQWSSDYVWTPITRHIAQQSLRLGSPDEHAPMVSSLHEIINASKTFSNGYDRGNLAEALMDIRVQRLQFGNYLRKSTIYGFNPDEETPRELCANVIENIDHRGVTSIIFSCGQSNTGEFMTMGPVHYGRFNFNNPIDRSAIVDQSIPFGERIPFCFTGFINPESLPYNIQKRAYVCIRYNHPIIHNREERKKLGIPLYEIEFDSALKIYIVPYNSNEPIREICITDRRMQSADRSATAAAASATIAQEDLMPTGKGITLANLPEYLTRVFIENYDRITEETDGTLYCSKTYTISHDMLMFDYNKAIRFIPWGEWKDKQLAAYFTRCELAIHSQLTFCFEKIGTMNYTTSAEDTIRKLAIRFGVPVPDVIRRYLDRNPPREISPLNYPPSAPNPENFDGKYNTACYAIHDINRVYTDTLIFTLNKLCSTRFHINHMDIDAILTAFIDSRFIAMNIMMDVGDQLEAYIRRAIGRE